jgi:hypothetical protein
MIDVTTKKPLRVTPDESAGPYIRLSLAQVDAIRRLFDSHGVRYWVSENAISLNNGPYMTIVNLGRGGDADAVQTLLDTVG